MPASPVTLVDDDFTLDPTSSAALAAVIRTHLPPVGRLTFAGAAEVAVAPAAPGPAAVGSVPAEDGAGLLQAPTVTSTASATAAPTVRRPREGLDMGSSRFGLPLQCRKDARRTHRGSP